MTDAELDQLVAEARDWQRRWNAGRVTPGTEVLIGGLLDALAAVRGERDRMRAALSAIEQGWVIETVATQTLARQALGDTHDRL